MKTCSVPKSKSSIAAGSGVAVLSAVLILTMSLIPQIGKAASGGMEESMVTYSNRLQNFGYLLVKVPIYDDRGNDEGLPNDSEGNYRSAIKLNGTEVVHFYSMEKPGSPQTSGDKYWVKSKIVSSDVARVSVFQSDDNSDYGDESNCTVLSSGSYTETSHSAVAGTAYAFYRIYPSADFLKSMGTSSRTLNVYLDIDENQGSGDHTIDLNYSFSFSYPAAPTMTYSYSNTAGKYDVKFMGGKDDQYYIYPIQSSYMTIESRGNVTNVVSRSDNEQKLTLKYYTKHTAYQMLYNESTLTIPGLQYPQELKAELNEDGTIDISWYIPSPSGSYVSGDYFDVRRVLKSDPRVYKEIGSLAYFNGGTGKITDNATNENLNDTYTYMVRRSDAKNKWGWDDYKSVDLAVAMKHKYISRAMAKVIEKSKVYIEWEYDDGNIYTSGSKIMLTRTNVETNVTANIELPDTCYGKRHYTEDILSSCQIYTYKISMVPGADAYKAQTAIDVSSVNDIVSQEVGQITSFDASKGYYSDRIELEWQTDGLPITSFLIKAREYGSGEEFKQIQSISADISSVTNSYFSYDYDKAVPGVTYEFKISSVSTCAGESKEVEYRKKAIGFRTPTGEVYGRVTFENGQAVSDAEVRAEATDGTGVSEKSYAFNGNSSLMSENTSLLTNAVNEVTLQAWIKPDGEGTIIEKSGMYSLKYSGDKIKFSAGEQTIESDSTVSSLTKTSAYIQVTAVADTELKIYINGKLNASAAKTATVTGNTNAVKIGSGYKGCIDEVRLWSIACDSTQIAQNYGAHLVGNETGLEAYYNFDYSVDAQFYDISYSGTKYNKNHGIVNGATLSGEIPATSLLGYKYYTDSDGSYFLRGLPYTGNGTTYMIIPTLGIHQFSPEKELRVLNTNSQSHTVNFTDKSSFPVSGTVTYEGGNLPVQGVSFMIDGVTAMDSKGNVLKSDATGKFTISVPVGQHEVVAVKTGHGFAGGGKITNSDGSDRNYQDMVSGIELTDTTRLRYIGRVSGGAYQKELAIGHPESRNNLADSIKVVLTYQNEAYTMTYGTKTETYELNKTAYNKEQPTNKVNYSGNVITIYPNEVTGEFYADVIPEKYKVDVIVPGHDDEPISGSGEEIIFSGQYAVNRELVTYNDSTYNEAHPTEVTDTVKYNKKSLFIKRYSPTIVVQEMSNGSLRDHFGNDSISMNLLDENLSFTAPTYDAENGSYTFGKPVYEQGQWVTYRIKTGEIYRYKDSKGKDKADVEPDIVPTAYGAITFTDTDLSTQNDTTLITDKNGIADWFFQINEPDMTTSTRRVAIQYTYIDSIASDNGIVEKTTKTDWDGNFEAIVLGYRSLGDDFITGGPDEILFVLRDPPGSNSYAYLEKGVSVTKSSSYTGSLNGKFSVGGGHKLGCEQIEYTGVGLGIVKMWYAKGEMSLAAVAEFSVGGTDSDTKKVTTSARIQTSSEPGYVGADGDVYVGFSTNISLGSTENTTIVTKELYELNPDMYDIYDNLSKSSDEYIIAKSKNMGFSRNYDTFFTYPQVFIEGTMIPKMIETRNSLLLKDTESEDYYKSLANSTKKNVYVSKLNESDPNYGKSNNDPVFSNSTDAEPSYAVYYPDNVYSADTISAINQNIDNWIKQIKANEEQKVKAEKQNNISFQSGTNFSYSQSYSMSRSETTRFKLSVGDEFVRKFDSEFSAKGFDIEFKQSASTKHGGDFTTNEEANMAHGFVLSESGGDYMSVDICTETGYNSGDQYHKYDELKDLSGYEGTFPTLIFKKEGGVTRCPYEDAYYTKYYEPGTKVDASTVQVEVPELSVEDNFIENVPSGEAAKFTLYLRNNSENQKDLYYDLSLDDSTNPYGAQLYMDGAALGNGRTIFVPAGETVTKIMEVRRGTAMNYDNIVLWLSSQCQCNLEDSQPDIYDAVSLSVHFIPSATNVNIKKPTDNWTYNTKLPTENIDDVLQHYMTVNLDGFDVNYDNFHRVMLQYKAASGTDEDWTTLMSYYTDSIAYDDAVKAGQSASMIAAEDAGSIAYKWFMDDMPDQKYDIRAVGTSMIGNVEYYNYSEVHSGIKDMYNPRLFGSAQPATGILSAGDEIRLNFNEAIADGLLTDNNFEVTGIRNDATTDHSVSVTFDGITSMLTEKADRAWQGKDLTVELWALADMPQDAVLFSFGVGKDVIELGISSDNHLTIRVGDETIKSSEAYTYDAGNWAHIAFTYATDGTVNGYYNYKEVISGIKAGIFSGKGHFTIGASIAKDKHFAGKIHNARIWDKICPLSRLQTNSLTMLSGAETNLLAYYPMNEGRGTVIQDKAHSVNMEMKNAEWTVPEGRALTLDGKTKYVKIPTGATVIDSTMDYTLELWFKALEGQKNATLASNGAGDGTDAYGSQHLFAIEISDSILTYRHNGIAIECAGDYQDKAWHHFAVSVNRNSGRGQIYIDGTLKTYFDSQDMGGIESEYICLGAKRYIANEAIDADTIVCNYFNGEIDEFRLWNLYRSESLTEAGMANRLDGTEKGLLAYYPFEHYTDWQGTAELQFTLDDQKEGSTSSAASVGGNVETAASAPIKSKEPVSDLLFDFVVNDDALIINLNEPYDRIEKSTVTFTVDGVRDLNGNEIVSPITWSAYIDRNQLKWSDSNLNISKMHGEELSFSVSAINNGGAIQHYSIENAPAWLKVSPVSGTIKPESNTDITFTINPALNIGSYDEIIYLRNDNNVAEALTLSVKVEGERPNWSVNPHEYQYSMSVFGRIIVDGTYSADKEDILAAFHGGKCVGVTNCSYIEANDSYYAPLTIYNESASNSGYTFKIWDASSGMTYTGSPSCPIKFVNDTVYGSPDRPVIFTAKKESVQTIENQPGWNWVSTFIDMSPENDAYYSIRSSGWSIGDMIKTEDGEVLSYASTGWSGIIGNPRCSTMYKIYCAAGNTIEITGTPIETGDYSIDLKGAVKGIPRWNYISYVPTITLPVKEALSGYKANEGDIIKSQTQMAMYSPTLGWVGSLEYMECGKGYMLMRTAEGGSALRYPATSAVTYASRTSTEYSPAYTHAFATNMTAILEIEGIEIKPGDIVCVYVDGELRGEAEVKEIAGDKKLFFTTLYGENGEQFDIAVCREGKPIGVAKSVLNYSANANQGSLKEPKRIRLNTSEGLTVTPNPFTTELTITANVATEEYAKVSITNTAGIEIARFEDCADGGTVNITWKVPAGLPDGIYFVSLIRGDNTETVKAIKK